MTYEWNRRHYIEMPKTAAEVDTNKEIKRHKRFNCCMSTGRLSLRTTTDDPANSKLGLGVAIYFKQLKTLFWFFLICSFASIPAFILYYYGGNHNTKMSS